jgi:hypothetical protein
VINVGAATEIEMEEKETRVQGTLHTTLAAVDGSWRQKAKVTMEVSHLYHGLGSERLARPA